jgi:hypothetical protein
MERCRGICERCGQLPDFRGLAVHHVGGKGMGGTTRKFYDNDYQLLCGKCHSREHGIKEAE